MKETKMDGTQEGADIPTPSKSLKLLKLNHARFKHFTQDFRFQEEAGGGIKISKKGSFKKK